MTTETLQDPRINDMTEATHSRFGQRLLSLEAFPDQLPTGFHVSPMSASINALHLSDPELIDNVGCTPDHISKINRLWQMFKNFDNSYPEEVRSNPPEATGFMANFWPALKGYLGIK